MSPSAADASTTAEHLAVRTNHIGQDVESHGVHVDALGRVREMNDCVLPLRRHFSSVNRPANGSVHTPSNF